MSKSEKNIINFLNLFYITVHAIFKLRNIVSADAGLRAQRL